MPDKKYVVVTGSVGAGASTLAEILQREWQADTLLENVIEQSNPFFQRAQQDPLRWGFASQVHFIVASVERHVTLTEMLNSGTPARVVIEDRTPFEHTGAYVAAFEADGSLPADEVQLLRQLATHMEHRYLAPDLLIYREMSEDQITGRVSARAREGEVTDFDKLKSIHTAFEAFIEGWSRSPVVRIPASLNLFDPGDREKALALISAVWTPPAA